ncbi:FecR/PupR family sigma factor regulator [Pseudomonas sp.]|uniref:FecR/PupR family sigma factor regulator n=1 Tax=Pseudomonas sp. TaxID=306 RepID=UPI0028A87CCB|nr:FecR/PupR family sigma factor regulator [Pseudomonas sp.]
MSKADAHVLDQTIVDQAIHSLVRLRFNQADAQTGHTFEQWLQQRPEHQPAGSGWKASVMTSPACRRNWRGKPSTAPARACAVGKA